MTLEEAFSIQEGEVISLVGAGGKTTLMFALGEELSSHHKGIILTTTTKIREPSKSPSFALFLSRNFLEIKKWVGENLAAYPYLIIAQEKLENGKLRGIPPRWAGELHSLPGVSFLIVEADGAAGRSLKAPREGEPVVPGETTLLVPVVGIDVLGCPLDERYVFRSEIAARLLQTGLGQRVTEEMIARLLREMIRFATKRARVIPFINKVDLPADLALGKKLARYMLSGEHGSVTSVLLGHARQSPVVKEVISLSVTF